MCYRKKLSFPIPVLVSALMLTGILTSCSRRGNPTDEVWAQVDGIPIYRHQVEAIYRQRMATAPGAGKPEQALSFQLDILNELIDREILLERAAQEQIVVSEKQADEQLARMRSPYSDEALRRELSGQGLTPAALRQRIRDELTIEALIQKEVSSRVRVTKDEITAYYDRNKADFNVPETEYHLAQILVTPVPDPQIRNLLHDDARNEREAERKIKALAALLKAGEEFAKVAADYSEDSRTATSGGDVGFIRASALASHPAVLRAVRSLKPGDVSGIIHDRQGFRIVKLLAKEDAGQRNLADPQVQDAIRRTLLDQKQEALKAAYMEDLRNQAHVVDYLAEKIVKTGAAASAAQ